MRFSFTDESDGLHFTPNASEADRGIGRARGAVRLGEHVDAASPAGAVGSDPTLLRTRFEVPTNAFMRGCGLASPQLLMGQDLGR